MGGHHFGQLYLFIPLLIYIDYCQPIEPRIITFLSYHLAHILHRDRGPLVYACIVWEFHESWTYRCIFLSLFFPTTALLHSFISHQSCFFVSHSLFYLLVLLHILSTSSGNPPQFITWGDSYIISTIYHTDTDLEILSLRRSSCQREFLLPQHLGVCIFIIGIIFGVHLSIFRVCVFVCVCVYIYIYKREEK